MRVLHLVHQYPPEFVGGTELYTQTLAHAQARLGLDVAVFARSYGGSPGLAETDEDGVHFYAASCGAASPTRRFLATFGDSMLGAAFGQILDRFRPDLVHVQHLMGLPTALLDQVRRRGIPYVVTLHDFWWFCANAQLVTNYDNTVCRGPAFWMNCTRCAVARSGNPMAWATAPLLWPLLARRTHLLRAELAGAALCLAATEFVRRLYVHHGLRSEQVEVLPLGVDAPAGLQSATRQADRPLQIVYAGGIAWQKGIHILVEAVNRLPGLCQLWLAGDLDFDRGYGQRLRSLAGPDVHFLGRLERTQVWDLLARADVVAVPSLWYETFSLLAHEAFAVGIPVVASDLGALAEVVRHEVDGLLAQPGEVGAWEAALRRLIATPDLLINLRAGVESPLTVDEHVARMLNAYARLEAEPSTAEPVSPNRAQP